MGGPFTPDFIEAVRASSDIVQVVSDYVPLKRAGRRLKGLCPFHQEKTPSFSVDPESQLFYCFGCQTGGDIFKFVQVYDKLNFGEAVETLASRFGVPLPAVQRTGGDDRERVLEINARALSFFKTLLTRDAGRDCRDYLAKRGYTFPAAWVTPGFQAALPKPRGLPVTIVRGRRGRVVQAEAGPRQESAGPIGSTT